MAERSERSASRVVIGTTVLQIFEGLVQYRLWVPWRIGGFSSPKVENVQRTPLVHHGPSIFLDFSHPAAKVALLCLAGTCFSPEVEVKLLPEQSGLQLWLGQSGSQLMDGIHVVKTDGRWHSAKPSK